MVKRVGEVTPELYGVTPPFGKVLQEARQKELGVGWDSVWESSHVERVTEGGDKCGMVAIHSLYEIQLMQVDVNCSDSGGITEAALKVRPKKKGKGRTSFR